MIGFPAGTRIWFAVGVTDMHCGFQGLAAKVQTAFEENPLGSNVFIFRGRRGDLVKLLWTTDDGLWLLAKRLERGRFILPRADRGKIHLTSAQLSMLLKGIDWRQPRHTAALSMLQTASTACKLRRIAKYVPLPTTVAKLQALVLEQWASIMNMMREITTRDDEIERLKAQIAKLGRIHIGSTSEKRVR
ncbi:IS66 family insertion sequence element accessory protein TnpB [Burkholderia stabilis]|uniref:IS66 family insertion sequence element accessory protein TnpB n=1 Tax=Burkholderia stabilis TaxID=95485 RepID=UPI00267B7E77